VDQIVTDQITNIESEFYDNKLLLKIYQTLWSIVCSIPVEDLVILLMLY
jgi:hypothetical protein